MREFLVIGSLSMTGVIFYVKAETLREAKDKFALGHYDSYDTDQAEPMDRIVDLSSIEENT